MTEAKARRTVPPGRATADALLALVTRLAQGPTDIDEVWGIVEGSSRSRSVRTAYRYLQALRDAGFKVSRGPCYELTEHPLPLDLDRDEAFLVVKLLEAASLGEGGDRGEIANSAREKVRASLRPRVLRYVDAVLSPDLEAEGLRRREGIKRGGGVSVNAVRCALAEGNSGPTLEETLGAFEDAERLDELALADERVRRTLGAGARREAVAAEARRILRAQIRELEQLRESRGDDRNDLVEADRDRREKFGPAHPAHEEDGCEGCGSFSHPPGSCPDHEGG